MIEDQLYALAFEYKKTKLWNILWDMDVFAVKLSDGNIGYISIMGAGGEHCALGLYIGAKGFQSFRILAEADHSKMNMLQMHEHILQQDCLQCAFEKKEELTDEEQDGVKQYARAHGIRLSGKNAYPQFVKYQPCCYPWQVQDEQEQKYLCEALSAAIALAKLLEKNSPEELGLKEIDGGTKTVVMLEMKDGACTLGEAELPMLEKVQNPEPKAVNDISLRKLKKVKREGVWECEIICCPHPIQKHKEQVPYFPFMLMAVERKSSYLLPVPPVPRYAENVEDLLDGFMSALLEHKICPLEIRVRDERTRMFFKSFCEKLTIRLRVQKKLPVLDEVEDIFEQEFGMGAPEQMENILDMLEDILEMDDDTLDSMPNEVVEQIRIMVEQGMLPEELEQRLRQKFNMLPSMPECSYVISVSLGTGCYRHIQISGNSTLETLHRAIIDAFEFDDDHAHAFFMDNEVWSARENYCAAGIRNDGRTTDQYRLSQVGLSKGMKFKYLFDFGDQWVFQCKVLRTVEDVSEKPVVIRSKGTAPEQYGDWEDGWDD